LNTLRITIFRNVTSCSQRFGETCCIHCQGCRLSARMVEAAGFSETAIWAIYYHIKWRRILEVGYFHNNCLRISNLNLLTYVRCSYVYFDLSLWADERVFDVKTLCTVCSGTYQECGQGVCPLSSVFCLCGFQQNKVYIR
jgi:hypothetical protein